jgi:hypothetical protein
MQCLFSSFADLHSLHIHNAAIEISNKPVPIVVALSCSTVRLSKIRFIVGSSVEDLSRSDTPCQLFVATGHSSTLALQDCVVESTFDSPALSKLVVCHVYEEGQVWDILSDHDLQGPTWVPADAAATQGTEGPSQVQRTRVSYTYTLPLPCLCTLQCR